VLPETIEMTMGWMIERMESMNRLSALADVLQRTPHTRDVYIPLNGMPIADHD
jgi:hypothetical protein